MTSSLVGSEMCIRDRSCEHLVNLKRRGELFYMTPSQFMMFRRAMGEEKTCLLYTSDAADDM
eukprot:2977655-Prorocentrum_lima.AAC.1